MKNIVLSSIIVLFFIIKALGASSPAVNQQGVQDEDTSSLNIRDTSLNHTMKGLATISIIIDTNTLDFKKIELSYLVLTEEESDSTIFRMNIAYLCNNREKEIASFYSRKIKEYVLSNKDWILKMNSSIIDKYDRFKLYLPFYVNKSRSD